MKNKDFDLLGVYGVVVDEERQIVLVDLEGRFDGVWCPDALKFKDPRAKRFLREYRRRQRLQQREAREQTINVRP